MIAGLVLLQAALTIAAAGPPTSPEYLPLHAAAALGYFAEEKLAVTIDTTRAEPLAAQALARGRAALAATSLDAALTQGNTGSAPPKLVFGLTGAAPVVLVLPAAQKDAVRDLGDLAGKTIGVVAPGTPGALALFSLLSRARIEVHQVKIESLGERPLVAAVASGAVAAAVLEDPWATRLIDEGTAVALADLRRPAEAARWLGPAAVHAGVFAAADTKLGDAELAPLARALSRAVARLRTAPPEALESALSRAVTGNPEDFALRLRGAREAYLADGVVSGDMLRAGVALVQRRSVIPAKVKLPRRLDTLLLMGPAEAAAAGGR